MFTDELRIGNWVQHIGYPLKVTGIKGSDVWVDGNGVELEYYIYDGINPIPITEEWLIKIGATSNPYEDRYEIGEIFIECNKTRGFTELWVDGRPHIKHVHQLQNLYFALTGDELDIK